jgi:hypothetical protein
LYSRSLLYQLKDRQAQIFYNPQLQYNPLVEKTIVFLDQLFDRTCAIFLFPACGLYRLSNKFPNLIKIYGMKRDPPLQTRGIF